MRKITAKTSKQELKNILNTNVVLVKEMSTELYDRIVYAGKMSKQDDSKVTRRDLADLAKEVITLLGDKFVEPAKPATENSTKLRGKKKEETPVEETPVETQKEEKVDEKSAKKSKLGKKKETPKKDGDVDSKKGTTQSIFPETIELADAKYRLAPEIKSMDDLYKTAIENGEKVIFAYHWSKKRLAKTPYLDNVLGKFTAFKDDLDLASPMYISEERKIAYFLSEYTEACYNVLPNDFKEVNGVRNAGLDFQIYKAI